MRTATIAVSRVRITGRSLARTTSQPEVAVSATPEPSAVAPRAPAATMRGESRSHAGTPGRGGGGRARWWSARAEQLGAVGDRDDAPALGEVEDDAVRHRGRLVVEVRCRLVEQHDPASGEAGSGEHQPGALPGGEPAAVVAEPGLQPVGLGGDHPVETDLAQGRPEVASDPARCRG